MDKYQCLTNKNYSVAGTYYSSNFNYLQIRVKKCMSQSYCKATDQINSIINGGRFSIGIANTIVDVQNYNQAIQYMIDDGFYWDLISGLRKRTDIYIRKNSVQLDDNYIQLGFTNNESFFQVVESTSSFSQESSSGEILSIYFRYDKYTDSYQRRIYSLGEVLGQAGGFYGSLLTIGFVLVFIFTERLFVTSVLRKIYQIDTWQEKEMLTKGPGAEKEHIKAAKGVVDGEQPIKNKRFPVSQSEKFHSQAAEDIKHFLNKHHYDHDQK